MLIVLIAIFRAALQPYIDAAERKYYHRIDHRFLVDSEIYFHPQTIHQYQRSIAVSNSY